MKVLKEGERDAEIETQMEREARVKQGRGQGTLQEGKVIQEEEETLTNLNSTFVNLNSTFIQASIVH